MPLYIVHRIQRDEIPADEFTRTPASVAVKFFPLRDGKTKELITLDAEDPDSAFKLAARAYPKFRAFLAIQPLEAYQNDLTRFSLAGANSRNFPSGPISARERTRTLPKSPNSLRRENSPA